MEKTRETLQVRNEAALLVNVTFPDSRVTAADSLDELEALARSAGAVITGRVVQNRRSPHPASYIGHGKALQIAQYVKQSGVDVVLFDNDLSPAQIRHLEETVACKVLDRSELILDIFASRAQTHEARLQVELAQLEYTYPRLTRMWTHLDSVVGAASGAAGAVGGIGARGPGEKQLEIDRRLVKKRIGNLRNQIAQIDRRKERQVRSRRDHFTVCLVGYTNAGKSSLLNCLTGSDAYVEDKLFATLDTKTARWNLAGDLYVLLSDTVGFVRNLPHHLVASFRATLEEAIHADLLLHVVDVSSPHAELQFQAAHAVLQEIGCDGKDILLVFNKLDKPGAPAQCDALLALYPQALAVSARTGAGLDRLIQAVTHRVTGQILRLRVVCLAADGRIPSFLHAHGTVLAQTCADSTIIYDARLGRNQLPALHRLQPLACDVLAP